MNLITDQWLPVRRRDGSEEKIAPHEVTKKFDSNPIVDLWAPRPDFRSALYQLFIGMFQVAVMPKDEDGWLELWDEPPKLEWLQEKLSAYQECFEIDSDGSAFMQDYSPLNTEPQPLDNLFISLPANGHFQKSDITNISPYWAAVALFTLQTFAPGGGSGHRVGLRGGGPLTTMVLPKKNRTLWGAIWLNILEKDELKYLSGDIGKDDLPAIFPWMAPTKTSEGGTITLPEDCHPCQMFFGMPRRIRLQFEHRSGICDLSGDQSDIVVSSYKTKNLGVNYDGPWLHPLNAYSINPKKPEEPPLSIKGQPGGITYRHWAGLAINSEKQIPAKVVQLLNTSSVRRNILEEYGANVWASGYDMDNMKARCWYESTMPLFPLSPEDSKVVKDRVSYFVGAAFEAAQNLRASVKSAWFKRPKDAKGDMSFLDTSFWQQTESVFYQNLGRLVKAPSDKELAAEIAKQWEREIKRTAQNLFDSWALSAQEDGLNMKRVVKARTELEKWLKNGKQMKALKNLQTSTE